MEYLFLLASALVSQVNSWWRPFPTHPGRILVIKLDHLGDVITALPAVGALRRRYPDAHIRLAVGSWAAALVRGHPWVNEVVVYGSPRFARTGRPVRWGMARRTARALFEPPPDLVVGLRDDWWTLWYSLRTDRAARVDRGTIRLRRKARLAAARLCRHAPPEDDLHEVFSNLCVAAAAGAPTRPVGPCLFPSEAARAWAAAWLPAPTRPLIVIHPGGAWAPGRWDPVRFAQVADRVIHEHTATVVVAGGPGEEGVVQAVADAMTCPPVLAPAGLSPDQWVALTSNADVCLCNDSAAAHVASALGTPVVALYGPDDPARFGAWSAHSVRLHTRVPCHPCGRDRCRRPQAPCVNLTEVEAVVQAVRGILARQADVTAVAAAQDGGPCASPGDPC